MTSDILTNQRFKTLPNASELRATAEKSRASAKVIVDDLIALLKARGSRTRIDLTKMVEQAARHVFGTHPDPFLESGVLFNWRTSSGNAHALSWQMQPRNPTPITKTDESEPGYWTEFWTSSVSDLMQNVCGITMILNDALDLFRTMTQPPDLTDLHGVMAPAGNKVPTKQARPQARETGETAGAFPDTLIDLDTRSTVLSLRL